MTIKRTRLSITVKKRLYFYISFLHFILYAALKRLGFEPAVTVV